MNVHLLASLRQQHQAQMRAGYDGHGINRRPQSSMRHLSLRRARRRVARWLRMMQAART